MSHPLPIFVSVFFNYDCIARLPLIQYVFLIVSLKDLKFYIPFDTSDLFTLEQDYAILVLT